MILVLSAAFAQEAIPCDKPAVNVEEAPVSLLVLPATPPAPVSVLVVPEPAPNAAPPPVTTSDTPAPPPKPEDEGCKVKPKR
jgi:hypothetical protein